MDKSNLIPGKKYHRRRKTIISGIKREAENWIKCERITEDGAVFSRYFEPDIVLSDQEIEKEIKEE